MASVLSTRSCDAGGVAARRPPPASIIAAHAGAAHSGVAGPAHGAARTEAAACLLTWPGASQEARLLHPRLWHAHRSAPPSATTTMARALGLLLLAALLVGTAAVHPDCQNARPAATCPAGSPNAGHYDCGCTCAPRRAIHGPGNAARCSWDDAVKGPLFGAPQRASALAGVCVGAATMMQSPPACAAHSLTALLPLPFPRDRVKVSGRPLGVLLRPRAGRLAAPGRGRRGVGRRLLLLLRVSRVPYGDGWNSAARRASERALSVKAADTTVL
jgi:hypothetical protein